MCAPLEVHPDPNGMELRLLVIIIAIIITVLSGSNRKLWSAKKEALWAQFEIIK